MKKNIGKTIKLLRENYGFTQKELAEKMGVSDKAVSKWERGLSIPDVSYLRKLAMVLDTDADELLAGNLVLNENTWAGILVFDDGSDENISPDTLVFDKQLINILICYFMLVRIKTIAIVASKKNIKIIQKIFRTGKKYDLKLIYYDGNIKENISKIKKDFSIFSNLMIEYKKYFIYGVGLSKLFQRAMTNINNITIVSLPMSKGIIKDKIYFDEDKKVLFDYKGKNAKEYNYYICPFIFLPLNRISILFNSVDYNKNLRDISKNNVLYTEIYYRGHYSQYINTKNSVRLLSDFLRILKKATGEEIYNIDEIYNRRKSPNGGI